mgnify:CR=1 FL=1
MKPKFNPAFTIKAPPLIFSQDDFCLALTDHSKMELVGLVADGVDIFVKAPSDIPRSNTEAMIDSYLFFLESRFTYNLNRDSDGMYWLAFLKFREFERRIHPNETHSHYRRYFEPIYHQTEEAFKSKDTVKIRQSLCELLDQIVRD